VLDPGEIAFDFKNAMLFRDVESQKEIYLDPAVVRSEYQHRLEAHSEGVEGICRKLGFAFHRIVTSRPMDLALLEFLRGRNRRDKRIQRRAQSASPP
jgi:hypothetical protein